MVRSGERDAELAGRVESLWGGPHEQAAPTLRVETPAVGAVQPLPLASSRVMADLALEHRRKGLLWYDTYTVDFAGRYRAKVPADVPPDARVVAEFVFPDDQGVYDGFRMRLDGTEAPSVQDLSGGLRVSRPVAPGSEVELEVAYRSRGLDRWIYRFVPQGIGEVRDFELVVTTDSGGIDFPAGTLSPAARSPVGEGERLVWAFDHLVSGQGLGVDLPNKTNPGPLAARITFFAPVSLLFFLTVFVVLGAVRRIDLHPMNYFFLAAAFFAFHLLLAYLVDHLNIHLAFALAAAVSLGLVGSYLRLVAGARGGVGLALLSQTVFLLLFSYAFFYRGFTGLTITIGAVATLFLLMQLTARVDWERALRPAASPSP